MSLSRAKGAGVKIPFGSLGSERVLPVFGKIPAGLSRKPVPNPVGINHLAEGLKLFLNYVWKSEGEPSTEVFRNTTLSLSLSLSFPPAQTELEASSAAELRFCPCWPQLARA